MSDVIQFSSNDIKGWLENETSAILTPVHAQATKLRDEMRDAIQNVMDVSKMLLDNSAKEIEKRNMRVYNRARAMNKLARLFTERIKKGNVPTNKRTSQYRKTIIRCRGGNGKHKERARSHRERDS